MVLLAILHGDANIKKIHDIGLLLLPVCISLPMRGTGSFPPIHW